MTPRKTNPKTTRTAPKTETKTAPMSKAKIAVGDGAPPPPPAPRAFQDLVLSEPWMRPWAEIAVATGSAADACTKVGISIADFAAARPRDPIFDGMCRLHEKVVDMRITEALCLGAIKGDARFVALYFGRVRKRMLDAGESPSDASLSAEVAEAMIKAGLAAVADSPGQNTPRPKDRSARPLHDDPDDE